MPSLALVNLHYLDILIFSGCTSRANTYTDLYTFRLDSVFYLPSRGSVTSTRAAGKLTVTEVDARRVSRY